MAASTNCAPEDNVAEQFPGGVKFDQDKERFELLPPEALFELSRLYTNGAKKYEARNWERGIAYARVIEPETKTNINLAARGWTPGTEGKIEGEVVIIKARTPEELKEYKGKLKNAIVLQGAPQRVAPITDTNMGGIFATYATTPMSSALYSRLHTYSH